jgi:hypothetical protein
LNTRELPGCLTWSPPVSRVPKGDGASRRPPPRNGPGPGPTGEAPPMTMMAESKTPPSFPSFTPSPRARHLTDALGQRLSEELDLRIRSIMLQERIATADRLLEIFDRLAKEVDRVAEGVSRLEKRQVALEGRHRVLLERAVPALRQSLARLRELDPAARTTAASPLLPSVTVQPPAEEVQVRATPPGLADEIGAIRSRRRTTSMRAGPRSDPSTLGRFRATPEPFPTPRPPSTPPGRPPVDGSPEVPPRGARD